MFVSRSKGECTEARTYNDRGCVYPHLVRLPSRTSLLNLLYESTSPIIHYDTVLPRPPYNQLILRGTAFDRRDSGEYRRGFACAYLPSDSQGHMLDAYLTYSLISPGVSGLIVATDIATHQNRTKLCRRIGVSGRAKLWLLRGRRSRLPLDSYPTVAVTTTANPKCLLQPVTSTTKSFHRYSD